MSIRIAIGTEPRTEIARKVLEYSILKTTFHKVEFHPLMGEDQYDRGDSGESTGFSFLRFSVPEYFNYDGMAIYLDADMLVLSDIAELWNLNDGKSIVWCKYGNETLEEAETSVMLLNCSKAKYKIKTISEIKEYLKDDINRKKYRNVMKLRYLEPQPKKLSKWWNVMDRNSLFSNINDFRSREARLLHFTAVRKQPWFNPDHPCADIWGKWLKAAVKNQYILKKELKEAVAKFDISNSRRPTGLHSRWLKLIK